MPRRIAAAILIVLAGLLLAGCPIEEGGSVFFVCGEDIVNDPAFREVLRLAPGQSSRAFFFTAFTGATYTAEVRILDGSQSFALALAARDAAGATYATGTIAAPALAFSFSPPTAGERHSLILTNQGSASLLFELRRLFARGSLESHAFGLDIHFAGPLGGLASAVSATAQDLAEGIRAYFEPNGIALAQVRVFEHSTAELRAAGIPVDGNGNAILEAFGLDPAHTNCGAGAGAIVGLEELGALAREDDDNIDLFLTGPITAGIVGVAPQGGRLEGRDAAVMAVEFLRTDGRPQNLSTLIRIAVHELGHFLSLPHTSDFDPGTGTFRDDGLADTPASTSFVDRDGDGIPSVGEGCADESNVLFPRLTGGVLWSEGQLDLMRRWLSLVPHAPFGVAVPTRTAALAFDTVQLPEAYADRPYNTGFLTRGGTGPVSVSIVAGALPQGLTLSAATGRLSGATSATGEFRIVVEARDSAGTPATVTRTYFVEVDPELLAAFYLPQVVQRPGLGTDVHVFPFTADGTPRSLVVTATGGEGRYRFLFPAATNLDPDTGVFTETSATTRTALDFLVVSDVNRDETAIGLVAGEQ